MDKDAVMNSDLKENYESEMDSTKKVSVILPVYNGERFLEDAINSIIKQSYANWELIIVNDCSTDSSREIMARYSKQDSRIRFIDNKTNQKLPKSLNVGFREATGDYLTWTSDDNLYAQNALETMVRYLDCNQDVALVYCDAENINENGELIGHNYREEPNHIPLGTTIGACFLYTRKVYESVGEYDPNMFLAEDYEYWVRIWLKWKMHHIKQVQYYYRIHGTSLSLTRQTEIKKQTKKLHDMYFNDFFQSFSSRSSRLKYLDHYMAYADPKEKKEAMAKCVGVDRFFIPYYGVMNLGRAVFDFAYMTKKLLFNHKGKVN